MKLAIYTINAFVGNNFKGNVAAVCPLSEWLPNATLQSIAKELNLSDTAFYIPSKEGFSLRWFTPVAEIDLCGHATLAAAHVISSLEKDAKETICFQTLSGNLFVTVTDNYLTMDFPSRPPQKCELPQPLTKGLGANPQDVMLSRDYVAIFSTEKEVLNLKPDFDVLKTLDGCGVIATAPGDKADFISRFFAPKFGINEDPVTGSAHCTLTPYWANRLNKQKLLAYQLSERGGIIWCELSDDRVILSGKCERKSKNIVKIPFDG